MAIKIKTYFCPHCKGQLGTTMHPWPDFVNGVGICPWTGCQKEFRDPDYVDWLWLFRRGKTTTGEKQSASGAVVDQGPNAVGSWIIFALGAAVMLGGIGWSAYLLKDGFRWWSLGTGLLALLGFSWATQAIKQCGPKPEKIWVAAVAILAFVVSAIFLVWHGMVLWSIIPAFFALAITAGLVVTLRNE